QMRRAELYQSRSSVPRQPGAQHGGHGGQRPLDAGRAKRQYETDRRAGSRDSRRQAQAARDRGRIRHDLTEHLVRQERRYLETCVMLSVEEFRRKYPNSTEEQVALYAAAVAAELADPPKPEPDVVMPMVTAVAPSARSSIPQSHITTYSRDAI